MQISTCQMCEAICGAGAECRYQLVGWCEAVGGAGAECRYQLVGWCEAVVAAGAECSCQLVGWCEAVGGAGAERANSAASNWPARHLETDEGASLLGDSAC